MAAVRTAGNCSAISGLRAADLVLGSATNVSCRRAVLLDSDLLLMIVEAPREQDALARQFAQPFFDSLAAGAR